jgi:hypothetical protein
MKVLVQVFWKIRNLQQLQVIIICQLLMTEAVLSECPLYFELDEIFLDNAAMNPPYIAINRVINSEEEPEPQLKRSLSPIEEQQYGETRPLQLSQLSTSIGLHHLLGTPNLKHLGIAGRLTAPGPILRLRVLLRQTFSTIIQILVILERALLMELILLAATHLHIQQLHVPEAKVQSPSLGVNDVSVVLLEAVLYLQSLEETPEDEDEVLPMKMF